MPQTARPATGLSRPGLGDSREQRKPGPLLNQKPRSVHQAAAAFPLMTDGEIHELAEDIRKHGQREPIVLHQGAILDGRNRYAACERIGVDPITREFDGDDPVGFAVSLNLKRRHLDESQRALIAAKIATLGDGQRQVGQLADVPPGPQQPKCSTSASDLFGVRVRCSKRLPQTSFLRLSAVRSP